MNILHLADLHLGKRVNEFSMIEDQKYILQQILKIAEEEKIDVVMLCGDIYDRTIPSVEAVELLDEFLCELNKTGKTVLMISGNHDSGDRLAFGTSFFRKSDLYISSRFHGELDRYIAEEGNTRINFWMLPFVKPVYVNHLLDIHTESYEECVRYLIEHTEINPKEINILMAHQFVTAGSGQPELSDSETSSLGGLDNVDYRIFDDFDYVALGHIHKPQAMGRPQVRYGGSILKYSFSEVKKDKEAVVLHIEEGQLMEMSFRKLTPLRDMREVRGTIGQIMNGEIQLGDTQDYVQLILTDEEEIIDAIGKVRKVFPNVMQIRLENQRYVNPGQIAMEEEDMMRQDRMSLFTEFYAMQNHVDMGTKEREFLQSVFEEVGK